MTINAQIIDGRGTKYKAKVHQDGALGIIAHPEPPLLIQKTKLFRQFLTNDGLVADGTNEDMGIDGSSTNVDFWIPASPTDDRYITQLSIAVGYGNTTGQPANWANGTALTNGSRLFYENPSGEIDIHDAIKSNQDFFRLNGDLIPADWEVRGVDAVNDFGYFIKVDLSSMLPPFGIKLDRGTTEKLVLRIRDNVGTDADAFTIIAMGFDRFE